MPRRYGSVRREVTRAMEAVWGQLFADVYLNPSGLRAMYALHKLGGFEVHDTVLAYAVGMPIENLMHSLRTLQSDGLIYRRQQANDVSYSFTPLGLSISKFMAKIKEKTEELPLPKKESEKIGLLNLKKHYDEVNKRVSLFTKPE